jgi:hypothetical protein
MTGHGVVVVEDPDDECLRAALHEAGHVIVAEALGRDPYAVVLFGAGEGLAHHYGPRVPADGWERLRTADARVEQGGRDDMAIALAGEVALGLAGYPDPGQGADGDRARARSAATRLTPWRDDPNLRAYVGRVNALLAEARGRTAQLLSDRYPEVTRLAETIRVNKRLAGNDLTVALEAAAKGWPTPRFDREGRFGFVLRHRQLVQQGVDWQVAMEMARAGHGIESETIQGGPALASEPVIVSGVPSGTAARSLADELYPMPVPRGPDHRDYQARLNFWTKAQRRAPQRGSARSVSVVRGGPTGVDFGANRRIIGTTE